MSLSSVQPPLLRPAALFDLPAILQIEHASFLHPAERFSHRTIRALIRSPRAKSVVAESPGEGSARSSDYLLGWAAGYSSFRKSSPSAVPSNAVAAPTPGQVSGCGTASIHGMTSGFAGTSAYNVASSVHPNPNAHLPWGRIYALAVHPHARGQKLGAKLLHYLIAHLSTAGAAQIFLEVRCDNHAAIGLYEKSGFSVCQSLPDYYAHQVSAHRMRLVVA